MKITLAKMHEHCPCSEDWNRILSALGKIPGEHSVVSIREILDRCGVEDALWNLRCVKGYQREIHFFALWCARKLERFLSPNKINLLRISQRHAQGLAFDSELEAAREASLEPDFAWDNSEAGMSASENNKAAAWDAVVAAAHSTDSANKGESAWDAAIAFVRVERENGALSVLHAELARLLDCLDSYQDPYATATFSVTMALDRPKSGWAQLRL